MRCDSVRPATVVLFALAILCTARAEGQFTTVINVPGDVLPSTIGPETQLNLLDGGKIQMLNVSGGEANILGGQSGRIVMQSGVVNVSAGAVFGGMGVAGSGEVRVAGGQITSSLRFEDQSRLHVTGGVLGPFPRSEFESSAHLYLGDQSVATFLGGTVPDDIQLAPKATLVLHGDNFRVNGALVTDNTTPGTSTIVVPKAGDVVTGILSDGTAFDFFPEGYYERYRPLPPLGTLEFIATPLPDPESELHIVSAQAPPSIRAGQTLHLGQGGTLPDGFYADWGSHLIVEGEDARGRVRAHGADVTVSAGRYVYVHADYGTQVMVAGGSNADLELRNSSHARMTGGTVGEVTVDDSEFIIEGGRVTGRLFTAFESDHALLALRGGVIEEPMFLGWRTDLEIAGGVFTRPGAFGPASTLIKGSDFAIDGVPIPGLPNVGDVIEYPHWSFRSVLTGTLADGTPLVMPLREFPALSGYSKFTLEVTEVPEVLAAHFVAPDAPAPRVLREGQSLTIEEGGTVDRFFRARGATIVLSGGTIGEEFKATETKLVVSGGTIGRSFVAVNSQITLAGGSIGPIAYLMARTQLDMSGGTIGSNSLLDGQSRAKVTAGTIGSNFQVRDSTLELEGGLVGPSMSVGGPYSVVTVKGGNIGDQLTVAGDATINVYGGEIGSVMTVRDRGVANIYRGQLGPKFTAGPNGVAHIHGGTFGEEISLLNLSTFTLYGTHFTLEGNDLLSLEPGVPYLLTTRDTTLTATLADGSLFELDLFTTQMPGRDYVHTGASLYLVLVQIPEPATLTLALLALSCLPLRRRLLNR